MSILNQMLTIMHERDRFHVVYQICKNPKGLSCSLCKFKQILFQKHHHLISLENKAYM